MEAFFNEREQLGIKPGDYATSGWQLGTYWELMLIVVQCGPASMRFT